MSECMTFPDTVEEFMEQYKVVDTEQVYTNGTEFVPIYRMKQWFQHKPERKTGWWLIREGISDAQCSECGIYFNDVYDMENSDAFCRHCGAKMKGLKVVKDE